MAKKPWNIERMEVQPGVPSPTLTGGRPTPAWIIILLLMALGIPFVGFVFVVYVLVAIATSV
ncbi:MAG: hypothetical protein GEV08_10190 [Acidimicrobiia bacterium]|nr:hypothetical protein [Acidimicrobiia bacterium]